MPGRAVGAAGAITVGVNEFGPPGVSVGAFSVGETGPPDDGGGELGAGDPVVGSGVLVGSSRLVHPAVDVAIATTAVAHTAKPTRRITPLASIAVPL